MEKKKGNETAGEKKKGFLRDMEDGTPDCFLGFEGRSPTIGCGDGRGVISE